MKIDKSKLMKKAWEIARTAVETFGGKVREYLGESLRAAWNIVKKTIDVDALKKIGREWKKGEHHRIYFNDLTDYIDSSLKSWQRKLINRSGSVYYDINKSAWFRNSEVADFFNEIKKNILALI